MKIYLVTLGEYSDYHIEAVFLDKQKAEYYAATHNEEEGRYLTYVVEKYDSSDEDVEISGSRPVRYLYTSEKHGVPVFDEPIVEYREWKTPWGENSDYRIVSAKPLGRAKVKKIAEDIRAKHRAEKEGLI